MELKPMIYAGSGNFNAEFPCHVDLSQMVTVRAVILQPDGSSVFRDIDAAVIATLIPGSVLPVPIDVGDFPVKGHYSMQVGAKDSGGTPLYFDAVQVEVLDPIVSDFWA